MDSISSQARHARWPLGCVAPLQAGARESAFLQIMVDDKEKGSPDGTNNRSASQLTKQPVNEQFT